MSIDVSAMKGPLGELFDQCSGENGQARFEEFKLWLKKVGQLLQHVRSVSVGAVMRFAVADHFKKDISETAVVKIAYLGDNFKKYFLDKIEDGISATILAAHTLLKSSLDAPIRTELGEKREITTLAHLYELLKKQAKGEDGILLTNGYANIFYMVGIDGNFWAVGVIWDSFGGGWDVGANSVENPRRWRDGNQVFSQAA